MNTNGTNGGPTRAAEIEAAVDAAVPGGWPRFALLAYARSSGASPGCRRALAVLAAQALEELEAAGADVSGVRAALAAPERTRQPEAPLGDGLYRDPALRPIALDGLDRAEGFMS